jgi:hypothetical protein
VVTFFTMPKAFDGHIGIIQRNAIKSWTLLNPRPEIILFGDDPGVKEAAEEFNVRYEPDIERNELGTPLVSSLFEQGQLLASNDVMVYINADIILLPDSVDALDDFIDEFGANPNFLGIGERIDIDITEPLDFSGDWDERLRAGVKERGIHHGPTGIDYFIFKRGLYQTIPPFAIGRTAWDNWLVSKALMQAVPVIDMTRRVLAVHQNHVYNHKSLDEKAENYKIMGDVPAMHVVHATHKMKQKE